MLRLLVGLVFVVVLATAGWSAGTALGGPQQAQLLALAGAFLAAMILVAIRTKTL